MGEVLVQSAGYATDAVVRDYAFADYLGPEEVVRRVDLAAFSEVPPSYRSACLAVARVSEDEAIAKTLEALKALGAHRVITLRQNRAAVWKLRAAHEPQKIDDRPAAEISRVIRTTPADWSPQAMTRLSGLSPTGSYQLDFADLGLVPLIERQVNDRIDRLIREVLVGARERDPSLARNRRRSQDLVRTVFQFLAAKVLADRNHPSVTKPLKGPSNALTAARRHYGIGASSDVRRNPIQEHILDWIWQRIRAGFHFQNLSVDSLAFVYENSLVSSEVRRSLGIHGTPRAIAELVVKLLPLEDLPEDRNVIFEPCSGFAPFLLAAMRRLRDRALTGLDPSERHVHLVKRLRGVEIDVFAVEVGRLCLTLADYPSSDGWELFQDDVFKPGVLESHLRHVGAVLTNPPFEAFEAEEKLHYSAIRSERPAELLRRIFDVCHPELLGLVMPRVVIESTRSGYRHLRSVLLREYREIDIIELPDNVFEYSSVESALLIARGHRGGQRTQLRTARVRPLESEAVLAGTFLPRWYGVSVCDASAHDVSLRVDELSEIWKRLDHLPKLGLVTTIHRGIEYRRPIGEVPAGPTSETPKAGYSPGVFSAGDVWPYGVRSGLYLNVKPHEIRCGRKHPWTAPKVIVNAARRARGWWRLTAAPDSQGLWCYQNLTGIWPVSPKEWPLELLAAALNGPIANAWTATRGDRHVRREVLAMIPLPQPTRLDLGRIVDLVRRARTGVTTEMVMQIDAEILQGYDLPPRLERKVLRLFDGEGRPGIAGFSGYYPPGFESALPLHRVLSDLGEENTANHLLEAVPVVHDPTVSGLFDQIAAGFDR